MDPVHDPCPCVMVIFGASGDLTKRKLVPALCNLAQAKLLPHDFSLTGFSHEFLTSEKFRLGMVKSRGVGARVQAGVGRERCDGPAEGGAGLTLTSGGRVSTPRR